jgi:hypothetical protein
MSLQGQYGLDSTRRRDNAIAQDAPLIPWTLRRAPHDRCMQALAASPEKSRAGIDTGLVRDFVI